MPIFKRFFRHENEHLARLINAYLREFIQEVRVGLPVIMLGGESVFLRGIRKKLWVAILSIQFLPLVRPSQQSLSPTKKSYSSISAHRRLSNLNFS